MFSKNSSAPEAYEDYYDTEVPTSWTDRYLWVLENFIGKIQDQVVLEIGCGSGGVIQFLHHANHVIGIDVSTTGIEAIAQKGVQAHLMDISVSPIPLADDSVDLVISLETFEHLSNPQFAINEIKRVLKAGGKLVCSIPNPLIGHPYLYPGLFTYRNFRRFLEQNGFSLEKRLGWGRSPWYSCWPRPLRIPLRILVFITEKLGICLFFFYWLWTFSLKCNKNYIEDSMLFKQAAATKPKKC